MTALRHKHSSRRVWLLLASATLGGVCGLIPSCEGMLTTFNPCGTVFEFCQPYEMDALFGTVPDFQLDPTCTIPYFGIYGNGNNTTGGGGGGTGGQGGVSGSCYNGLVYPFTPGPRPDGQTGS